MSEQEYEFQAEIRKLLNILSKSLYQHKEIFLRELISNAVDASKKLDFILLTNRDIRDADEELRIEIYFNEEEKTLTIRDYGVGMTKNQLINDLGTIAGSGTEKFLKKLEEADQKESKKLDLDIIGQFGIGFYSVFMVAESVKVRTRHYSKDEDAYEWTSEGTGKFNITETDKEKRGTDIILYLNEEDTEYLNDYRIKEIINKYSKFVPYPIYIFELEEGEIPERGKIKEEEPEEAEKEEKVEEKEEKGPKPINKTTPLWKKSKSEITEEEYKDFYHYISNRYDDYHHVINYKVDGRVRFRSILFIPSSPTQDMLQQDADYGLSLYSKSVLIMKYAKELIPQWMRFVKGVLESEDIPLNISRETIQANREIMKMSNLIVKKFLRELSDLAEKDNEKYMEFWENFGQFIKEGIVTDVARKEKLKKLLRFKTSKAEDDELIGLEDYVKRMKEDQEEIYYLVGEDLNTMESSPHLGYYKEKELEVILFDETIDNFLMMNMNHYEIKGKKEEGEEEGSKFLRFSAIDVAEPEKEKEEEGEEEKKEEKEELPEEIQKFLEYIESILDEKIIKATVSKRLYGNPCRLANPAEGPSSSAQRAMRYWTQVQAGKEFNIPKKIFEINPEHPTMKKLIKFHKEKEDEETVKSIIIQLFENSLLAEGDLPNPSSMVPRINQIIEDLLTKRE
ncbi:MAG: Chaperone protein [Promethearchaeota archaeon]|nr:MAG: Chaperone protein [Candidatus Lokiarchaeota archaeon]